MIFYLSFDLMVKVKSAESMDIAELIVQNAMKKGEIWQPLFICRAIAYEIREGHYSPTIDVVKIKVPMRGKK